ncbi:MAG: N-acetylmuramoyl-L-alanine amidase [Helicobacteraceae bacterium]|jgi:N-acetylmuramoyl-L-alanine amidase|nr:N-acetylmuramoyl-L-alanine amidase [Helicobacteraceae bacterium]
MGKRFKLFCLFLICLPVAAAQTLESYTPAKERLTLEFSQPIMRSDYSRFIIKASGGEPYRNVIDIKAAYLLKTFVDTKTASVAVKIAQFNATTTRVVLSRPDAFEIDVRTENKTMMIDIKSKERGKDEKASENPFGSFIVAVDAGHGGKDTGAIGIGKVSEKELVLKVALLTGKKLKERGFKVFLTREEDKYLSLHDRTGLANKVEADLFISIHANAGPKSKGGDKLEGVETYFLSPARSDRAKEVAALENGVVVDNMEHYSKETFLNFLNREMVVSSNKLAIDLQRGMLFEARKHFAKVRDSGVREGPFWVLVGAQMPAVLVEIGYVTHKEDIKRLVSEKYQQALADGIVLGVENYLMHEVLGGRN